MASRTHRSLSEAFHLRQKQVEALSDKAEAVVEQNLVRKFSNLLAVRRFVIGWVLLVLLLIAGLLLQISGLGGYYRILKPVAGGMYAEGIVGSFNNANPLYATGQADDAVSKLLFASLFTYDSHNKLVGELASGYDADPGGEVYTVHLKPGLRWHDGQPLTAQDVAFTYRTIQNPDTNSPLGTSWQRVGIEAPDSRTVRFTLPNPLSSFPYSLTNGIIPVHILGKTAPGQLRSSTFNTANPVGSGPFRFKTLEVTGDTPATRQIEIALEPFDRYVGGKPKLTSLIIHTFPDDKAMLKSFRDQSITAMVGLDSLPADIAKQSTVQSDGMPLAAATMVFFKTSSGVLNDVAVRQALVGGSDPKRVIAGLGYAALPVREPLLQSQPGYTPAYEQLHTGVAAAEQTLNAAGWVPGSDGIRVKAGQRLAFKLYAQNTSEYGRVANELRRQWRELGVDVQVYLQSEPDLRSTVTYHSYDALLYGISIGVDPDVFAYWDSTQADVRSPSRLNFSEYSSPVSDAALEAGRTRSEPELRTIKYQPFLQAWQHDAPALGLYQPRFLYVTRGQVFGLSDHTLTTDTDRFNNVQNWMIRQAVSSQ